MGNRRYHRITGNLELTALDGGGAPPAGGIRLAQLHPYAAEGGDLSIVMQDLHWLGQRFQVDSLLEGFIDLPLVGRHLGAAPAIHNRDIARAHADRCAGCVDGGVAAAYHHDAVAEVDRIGLAEGHRTQEGDTVEHPTCFVFAGNAQLLRLVGTNGQEYGRKSRGEQAVDVAHRMVELQIDAESKDLVDLTIEHFPGQSIGGDAHPGHTAGHRQSFKDRHRVAHPGQKVGTRQSGRSSADNGHASPIRAG